MHIKNQLSAKMALDSIKKTSLWPEPYLVYYYSQAEKVTAFCWVAKDNESSTTVIIHPFPEDIELDKNFDHSDMIRLKAPCYFFCKQGAFVLKSDNECHTRLCKINAVTSLSMAQNFAKDCGLNPQSLVLYEQRVQNEMINAVWLDVSSSNNAYIPVWPQDKSKVGKKWTGKPIRTDDTFFFNKRKYIACKYFEEMCIEEILPKRLRTR